MAESAAAGGISHNQIDQNQKRQQNSSLQRYQISINNHHLVRKVLKISLLLSAAALAIFLLLSHPADRFQFLTSSSSEVELRRVLKKVATADKTVVITTLNEAWAAPNSTFDLFLESFKVGDQTKPLLDHLLVVALDQKAYAQCLKVHPNCYTLITDGTDFSGQEAFFMTEDYLKMMWSRIQFLRTVLDVGYNFIFTDADIMWFRDPLPHFHPDADFQIACDYFRGDPSSLNNLPNGGFTYAKSNKKTRQFYKFWYESRSFYPQSHDQDVFNKIKYHPFLQKIGLQIRFLETRFFGGFCEHSDDFDLVCTMHANCCVGLDNKVYDLKIMLEDWRKYLLASKNSTSEEKSYWTVPQHCGASSFRPRDISKKGEQEGT